MDGGWWDAFVYYMGVWILMMFTFDYARFGKREDQAYHSRFNFGMPFYLVTFLLNGVAGIYLVSTIPSDAALSEVSVVLALLKLMGLGGLLFVWITQTRINTANYYLATINMQAFFARFSGMRWSKAVWAVAVGAVTYALMLLDLFSYLLQALAYQGIFVVSWVAVALVHILSGDDGTVSSGGAAFNRAGLTGWFAGAICGLALMHGGLRGHAGRAGQLRGVGAGVPGAPARRAGWLRPARSGRRCVVGHTGRASYQSCGGALAPACVHSGA